MSVKSGGTEPGLIRSHLAAIAAHDIERRTA